MTTNTVIGATVDKLFLLQAQIATLHVQEAEILKAVKAALPDGPYEGVLARMAVASSVRKALDPKAAQAKLRSFGVPTRWFTAHTKRTDVRTVTVRARTGEGLLNAA
jgi:hypothetical protein